ncbi:predicted protein [Botrytis cinerea T4]|uniref:Uncharacterized protein n=1 Tax=Botryotinia fuckeliana (strain T4) TaxID=999810 RepID=G2XRY9_BOTF4|nr:predicted protein [Botrytis cinerea T4]
MCQSSLMASWIRLIRVKDRSSQFRDRGARNYGAVATPKLDAPSTEPRW